MRQFSKPSITVFSIDYAFEMALRLVANCAVYLAPKNLDFSERKSPKMPCLRRLSGFRHYEDPKRPETYARQMIWGIDTPKKKRFSERKPSVILDTHYRLL